MTRIRELLANVVMLCWINPITTKSNTAREEADWFAAAASEGYLTTRLGPDNYSRLWLPTPVGLEFLSEIDSELEF